MDKREIISITVLAVFLIFVMIFLPSVIGFASQGFDTAEVVQKFTIYVAIGVGSLLGILVSAVIEQVISKGDKKYGNSVVFASPGKPPAISFFKRFTNIQLLFLSTLFFLLFTTVLYGTGIAQTSFVGIRHLEQQFTPASDTVFSSLLVPASENLAIAFAIAFILTLGIRRIARKYEWNTINFKTTAYSTIPITIGFLGVANHLLRYSGSDINIFNVFVFWFLIGLLTILSGSFVIGWSLHTSNNVIFALKDLGVAKELIVTYSLIVAVIIGILYFLIYKGELLGKEINEREDLF